MTSAWNVFSRCRDTRFWCVGVRFCFDQQIIRSDSAVVALSAGEMVCKILVDWVAIISAKDTVP